VIVKASMELLPGSSDASLVENPLGGAVSTHDMIQHLGLTSLRVVAEANPHAVLVRLVDTPKLEPLGGSNVG
jgi:hypothetical protein